MSCLGGKANTLTKKRNWLFRVKCGNDFCIEDKKMKFTRLLVIPAKAGMTLLRVDFYMQDLFPHSTPKNREILIKEN